MYLIILLVMFGASDIDSVNIAGECSGYISESDTEAYFSIRINDKLDMVFALKFPEMLAGVQYKLEYDANYHWFVVIKGHHAYRIINGEKKLIVVADKSKWLRRGRLNK